MPLRPRESIKIDRYALRHGEEAAGYIVMLISVNRTEDKYLGDFVFEINNQLFRAEEDAVQYAMTCSPGFQIIVKALRWD